MKKPNAIILSGYGINCERETAYAFERAGANHQTVHINDLLKDKAMLDSCQILIWPGGFSMGDDTGSGLAYANYAKDALTDGLDRFIRRNTLSIGICNGFQIMTHMGFFPIADNRYGTPRTALVSNSSARYIDTWVDLVNADTTGKCAWTRGIQSLHLPIAHGEGRFYADERTMQLLRKSGQIVFKYANPDSTPADGGPANPNGSIDDIAAICDPTGRFMGMMPHPERAILPIQDDTYTHKREVAARIGKKLPEETACMIIFRNAVEYFK